MNFNPLYITSSYAFLILNIFIRLLFLSRCTEPQSHKNPQKSNIKQTQSTFKFYFINIIQENMTIDWSLNNEQRHVCLVLLVKSEFYRSGCNVATSLSDWISCSPYWDVSWKKHFDLGFISVVTHQQVAVVMLKQLNILLVFESASANLTVDVIIQLFEKRVVDHQRARQA